MTQMTIKALICSNELLSLQKEIQRILADKGYVQYEELDRGSKGDFVSDVQQRLKELFFYNGNITGKYDTETQKAFKQFEKYNNLTNDGKASQSDLLILFSSVALSKPTSSPAAAVTFTPALERVHTIDNKEISDIMESCR